ncbi:rhomboid family intramembrane serine protease [Inhella gelatinilytica]|uniref:Rhomboid family intramembrane serine protease n=1 Tax=Inhella gelatinilytica TaxID=2795030 RepID=A0A931NFQ4_9BURK|nr:rhomboid family intramembrane serine protease [Inhella gelatinilytica]MBH9553791.1 rhomboid family intramembrane serine protease [Inhella gelatinilytica]
MPKLPPLTQAFMLACVALFCLQILWPALGLWLALFPLQSPYFLPWQVVSYAFLHGDVLHLFFNMLGLWMFGSEIETVFGPRRYAQLLGASILSAAAAQLLFTALAGVNAPTVGASGALFGLLLTYALLFPNRVIMPLFPPIPMKAKVFVAVFGAMELFFGLTGGLGIAHFAHLGGMVGAYGLMRHWRGGRR